MNDTVIISELSASYSKQIRWYRDLSGLVQKTLSQLVLSRGNVAGVMGNFEKKQQIFSHIAEERRRISEAAAQWQTRKPHASSSREADKLDGLLSETETVIKEFLDGEEQLKRYLEHMARPVGAPGSGSFGDAPGITEPRPS